MSMLPPGGPNQGEKWMDGIYPPGYPVSPDAGDWPNPMVKARFGAVGAMDALDPVANQGSLFLRTDMGDGTQKAWFFAMDGAWTQTTPVF